MAINAAQLMITIGTNTQLAEQGIMGVAKLLGAGGPLGIASVAGVAAVAGIGIAATKMAGDFQAGMLTLVTGAGESQNNLQMVSDGILTMARDTGTSTKQLTDGMFMIESAGFHGAAGLNVLQVAAEGAKVGNADLGTTADALTTILKDYPTTANGATGAMNVLIATVANGKTHMEDLAGSLSGILPVASASHVSLTDVAGAMSTLTGEGVDAANASTYLRQMIIALDAPGTQAKKTLADIGLSAADVSAEMQKSLPGALQMIQTHLAATYKVGSPQYIAALKDISGGMREMQGMLDLTGTHLGSFQQNVVTVAGALKTGGTTVTGWNLVQDTFNQKLAKLGEVFQTLMIQLGQKLLPVMTAVVGFLADKIPAAVDFVSQHFDQIKTVIAVLAAVIAPIPVVIGVLVGAFINAYNHSAPLRAALASLGEHLSHLASVVTGALGTAFNRILPVLQHLGAEIMPHVQQAMKDLMPHLTAAAKAVSGFADDLSVRLGPAITNIANFIVKAIQVIQPIWNAAWPAMSLILQGVWNIIKGVIEVAWSLVSGIIKVGLDILGGNWKQAWTDMQAMFGGIWDGIKTMLSGAWKAIVGMILGGVSNVLEVLSHVPGPIGDMASKALHQVQAMANGVSGSTATMQTDTLKHLAEMDVASIAHLSSMRAGILKEIANTTDPAKKKALEMQLAVVDHERQLKEQSLKHVQELAVKHNASMTLLRDQSKQHAKEMQEGVLGHIGDMIGGVLGAIGGLRDHARAQLGELKDAAIQKAKDLASGFVSALTGLPGNLLNLGKNLIQNLINGIGSMAGALNDKIKSIPGLGGLVSGGENLLSGIGSHLPHFATGGTMGHDGPALVGEAGPEIVRLPGGAQITPLSRLVHGLPTGLGALGGAGERAEQTIIIQLDGKTLAKQTVKHLPSTVRLYTGGRAV